MTSPRHKSIGTKLAIGFASALALIGTVGLLSLLQLRSLDRITREISDEWLPRIEMLATIKNAAAEHRMLATTRAQMSDPQSIAAVIQEMDAARSTLHATSDAYRRSADLPQEQQLLGEFLGHWSTYEATLGPVFQRLKAGDIPAAHAEYTSASLLAFSSASGTLNELTALAKERSQDATARAASAYRIAQLLTIAAVTAVALLALAGILWISRNVSSPLRQISDAMRRLTAGDDSVAVIDDPERTDEIGTLAAAANSYRDSLVRSRRLGERAELERGHLYAAVSNMPIGLTMFDSREELIICNDRYAELYKLPGELTRPGTTLIDMLRERIRTGNVDVDDPEKYIERVLAIARERKPALNLIKLKDGRIVSVCHQPVAGGGWVATHEDVTERRRAEERIHHMARHDALTDLPNRTLFREHVDEALSHAACVAVLCLDLDHFKSVNDTLGHPVGDELLEIVANRLRASVRQSDIVARFGGDEFAIAQFGAEQPEEATALAQRTIEALRVPYSINGHRVVIGASVGIAVAPSDGRDADQLVRNGDLALYRAKTDGRNTYRFFEPEMDARMQARRALELDLRRAVAEREFDVYYQPVVNLQANEVRSFEALLRWHHPQRGLVLPAEFIPLAEEIGIIVPLGEWVLRKACTDAASWPPPMQVSVNLSPAQFQDKKLLETVVTALAVSKLPAERLELEITEGVLLADHEATLAVLHQLRGLGVRIAVDDFGTGYSSLSYLRSFPFDKIKIDRSFVQNISDDDSSLAIIRAVAGLGASLGIATTAEGVETREQLDRVRAERCTEVQGFFFSEARPAEEIMPLLRALHKQAEAAA